MPIRVITPLGLGEVDRVLRRVGTTMEVKLDNGLPWQKRVVMDTSQVFPFTDIATVRIIASEGLGPFLNLQFQGYDHRGIGDFNVPSDEIVISMSLGSGDFLAIQKPQPPAYEEFLWIRPRIDCWKLGQLTWFKNIRDALDTFQIAAEQTAGSSEGICASILMDVERRKILRFLLLAPIPSGVVWEKQFPIDEFLLMDGAAKPRV